MLGVSIWVIRALVELLERSGFERTLCLRRLGLSAQQLADDAARVSLFAYRDVVRAALDLTGDAALGLRVGVEGVSFASFDALGLLVQQSRTLRGALSTFNAYATVATDGPRFEVLEEGDVATIQILIPVGGKLELRFFAELATSALQVHLLRPCFGARARALGVHFPYCAPSHRATYTRVFHGAEVFDQSFTGFSLERAWLDRPLTQPSNELRALLRARADDLRARVGRGSTARERVKRWLSVQDPGSKPRMVDAARALGMSPRTLRRLLSREETDFTHLSDAARAEHAMRLLSAGTSSVQEVSYALGFATHAAFTRAFRRWTGSTPSAFRRRPWPASAAS